MAGLLHTLAAVSTLLFHLVLNSNHLSSGYVISAHSSNRLLSHAPSPASSVGGATLSHSSQQSRRFALLASDSTASAPSSTDGAAFRFVAGVEAHIQLALPRKIFCNCPSTASCGADDAKQPDSAPESSPDSGPDVAAGARCMELHRRLSDILAAATSEVSSRPYAADSPYSKQDGGIQFEEYVRIYNQSRGAAHGNPEDHLPRAAGAGTFERPNQFTCPVCKGEVGALPALSPLAVLYGLAACHAFSCQPSTSTSFERKVYSYPDLPKRYQLTQARNPIGRNGHILLSSGREIRVQRVNLEEDTARTLSADGEPLSLDYNRSGIGLVEVVTEASEVTAEELVDCCSKIAEAAVSSGLCKGLMHEGNLRFDVNLSVPAEGSKRVELKNLNSFRRIRRAVLQCLSSGRWTQGTDSPAEGAITLDAAASGSHRHNAWNDMLHRHFHHRGAPDATAPVGATLAWRSANKDVQYQRPKSSGSWYLNIADSNIPTLTLTPQLTATVASVALSDDRPTLEALHAAFPAVPLDLLAVVRKTNARIDLFRRLCSTHGEPGFVAKWLVNYILPLVGARSVDVEQLCELLQAVSAKRLNVDTARRMLPDFLASGLSLDEYMRCHGLGLLDEPSTRQFVDEYLARCAAKGPPRTLGAAALTRLVRDIVAASGHRLSYSLVRDYLAPPAGPG
ncbi:Asp-tRNA(Asn)/Glu-tRNA(Gln) amidotransferase subunit GatB [Babesia caballi]|uniref:Asp-tRNA(Asn)/Glu-tRNA(Gln) amidotransferase subunit GatB n=1 Tax=Babesia caballi TaxID=5871 RepID=A0AAV4LS20_BABCB|nr:Asp-tRNA(Asn)/Glu-tRNA(Gln) amidotransferase subunit GatB [Babesia caballi]